MDIEAPALQAVLVAAAQKGGPAHADLRHVTRRWWSVARLWWRCPTERKTAWRYTAASVGLSLPYVALLLWISYVQNAMHSSLSEKQQAGFFAAVRDFLVIILIAAPLFAFVDYVDSCLAVAWRRWLTQHMIRCYFAHHSYYALKLDPQALDNPDQRICEDVRNYVNTSVLLTVAVMRKLLNCLAFTGVLWSLAPGLAVFLFFYAVAGTYITAAGFGRRLMRLTYAVLQREADLRFALVRVRENAESIAFYSGDQRESELAGARLARTVRTIFGKVRWEAYLSLWQNVYQYATILLPSLLLCQRYFAGVIRYGDISQAAFAFHTIEGALSYIVTHLSDISQLAAQTDRLEALLAALVHQAEGLPGGIHRKPSTDGGIAIQDLTLTTPRGEQTVCRGLTLALAPGQSLLIVGPSGVGKTSLMRAMAGLWSTGSGTIAAPADMFFLPQRPYMPLGSLLEQLTFPDSFASIAGKATGAPGESPGDTGGSAARRHSGSGGGDSDSGEEDAGTLPAQAVGSGGARRLPIVRSGPSAAGYRRVASSKGIATGAEAPRGPDVSGPGRLCTSPALDAELRELLSTVCLPNLLARVGGLDAEADWAHILSLGEQQRVSFARLLHHKPSICFLDEASSALDTATERALYTHLQRHCRCYISIAHRKQLAAFHTHVLEAAGDGTWVVHEAGSYLRALGSGE